MAEGPSDDRALIEAARQVRKNAHAPYSNFLVGAAVLARSGAVYVGCNVENASYGATQCAERNAIAAMVAAGEKEIAAIVVFTEQPELTMPCGICRQVIFEFGAGVRVLAANSVGSREFEIGALLPEAFRLR